MAKTQASPSIRQSGSSEQGQRLNRLAHLEETVQVGLLLCDRALAKNAAPGPILEALQDLLRKVSRSKVFHSKASNPSTGRRPRDVVGNALRVAKTATGESQNAAKPAKRSDAVTLGSLGGTARAKNLTKTRRSQIAKDAAAARWKPK